MNYYAQGGLHRTAHYLKSKGRGRDTELVHMSKREIKGLQELALAHGGSLSINPETGLVEAGFLEQILPIVAAAGLTYLTAGAAAPTLTAALGGSAMAGGIAAGALSGAAISGGMAAIQGKDAGQAALMGGLGGAISGGMGAYDAANVFNAPNLLADASQQVVTNAGTEAGKEISKQALGTAAIPDVSTNLAGYNISMPNPSAPGTFINPEVGPMGGTITEALNPNATQAGINAANMAPGEAQRTALNKLAQDTNTLAEGSKQLANSTSYYSGLKPDQYIQKAAIQGLPAVAGAMGSETYDQQVGPQDDYQSSLRRLSPNFRAYEPPRPNPYYRAQYAADGGVMNSFDDENGSDMASGGIARYAPGGQINLQGTVNLDQNSIGGSNMNPTGGLSNQISPIEGVTQPFTQPMILPFTQPMTGASPLGSPKFAVQPRDYNEPFRTMASGGMVAFANTGAVKLPKGNPGIYRDADPTTRGQDAFTAALTRLNSLQKRANIKGLPALKTAAPPLSDIQEAAKGGIMSGLGGYSDGGRMLKGPGDGMSDSIPGVIGNKQPARLADGEFVVPADVVSHLGNGSTDAGAKKLYAMMDNIRKARTGKKKQAPAVKANRYMPA